MCQFRTTFLPFTKALSFIGIFGKDTSPHYSLHPGKRFFFFLKSKYCASTTSVDDCYIEPTLFLHQFPIASCVRLSR